MGAAEVIALLSLLAAVGGGIASGVSSSKQQKAIEKAQKEQKETQEEMQRRAALQRAIRSEQVFKPREMPELPEMKDNVGGGIASGVGQLGLSAYSTGLLNKLGVGNRYA